jgi:hypothetical protein
MRRISIAHGLVGYVIYVLLGAGRLISVDAKPSAPSEDILVPAGSEVMILTKTDISSNTVFVSETLTFEVARDVMINGQVVIAKGALVEALVTMAINPKSFGRGGKLGISVENVTAVDGRKIKLRGALNERGDVLTGKAAILTVLGGGWLGGGLKGSNARIKAGKEIKVETAEEKTVSVGGQPTTQDQDEIPGDPLLK